jgi:restriction endonuclease S subunit
MNLSDFQEHAESVASHADNQSNINAKNLDIALPDIKIQNQIVSKIEKIE